MDQSLFEHAVPLHCTVFQSLFEHAVPLQSTVFQSDE